MWKLFDWLGGERLMVFMAGLIPAPGESFVCFTWGHRPDKWTGDRALCKRCNQVIVWRLPSEGWALKVKLAQLFYELAERILES